VLNPVAAAVVLILGVLAATATSHAIYFAGAVHAPPARAGHGGHGPAVVAQPDQLRRMLLR
jgi:hypothetical protein